MEKKFKNQKCLIVGASGLIGSHLLDELYTRGEIFAFCRRNLDKKNMRSLRWIQADLTRSWNAQILPKRVDSVIYLAQAENFRDFPKKAAEIFTINTERVFRFLDYARIAGAKTFILASSGGVKTIEKGRHSCDELGFYHTTRFCAEVLAKNYTSCMNVIILRFFFVYGPGQQKTMLMPRLVKSVLDKRPILLSGKEGIAINPTHVSDAVKAIVAALKIRGSRTIDIAGPKVYTMRNIGEIIGSTVGIKPVFKIQSRNAAADIIGDISEMTKALGRPLVTFEEGIKSLL